MQKFNINNVETRFIKNILSSTYLPLFPILKNGDYMVTNTMYAYGDKILKCIKSGRFDSTTKAAVCDSDVVCDISLICGSGKSPGELQDILEFNHEKFTPGICNNFNSNKSYYDSELHKALGNYLRWYNSYYNIDLMPLYNCFTGDSTESIYLEGNTFKDSHNGAYTIWTIPALLNKKYSIFIDCDKPITIGSTFLNGLGRIKGSSQKEVYLDEYFSDRTRIYNNTSYNNPIEYSTSTSDTSLMSYFKDYYIIIQVPKEHVGSITVIEGGINSNRINTVVTREIFKKSKKNIFGNPYPEFNYDDFIPDVVPSLSRISNSYNIPYSGRLIEYLSKYAIGNHEEISNNIARIYDKANLSGQYGTVRDTWDSILKYVLYHKYFNYSNNKFFSSQPTIDEVMKSSIPTDNLIWKKDQEGKNVELIGLKNMNLIWSTPRQADILGYIDKDVENVLYKYRRF